MLSLLLALQLVLPQRDALAASPPPLQVLRVLEPPARPFVVHGTVPVRSGAEAARLTSSSPEGEQVRVVLAGPVWTLLEVAAPVPAGTRLLELRAGEPRGAPSATSILPALAAFARRPLLTLVLAGQDGLEERVALGVGAPWTRGAWRLGFRGVVQTRDFGCLRWWTTANAGDPRCWLTLRWSNAVDVAGRARGEFLLRSARLEGLPSSVEWASETPDPSVGQGWLVRPLDHVFPQRGVRDFRLVFYPSSSIEGPRAPDGWGAADWRAGGWLPAGLAVPPLEGAAAATRARAALEWESFASLRGTGGATEAPRCSWLWPYAGVPYGGMTGEVDVWPYDGCLTASSGAREGLALHRILAQRYGCRQLLAWEADGSPLDPSRHLSANGEAPWSLFDFVYQRQYGAPGGSNDAPWEFDQVPRPAGPRAYSFETAGVAPIDLQHLVRAVKDARALVWLDGDPAAAEYLVCVAEHARSTFWTGAGRARRMVPPLVAGQAWEVGRAEAWTGSVAAVAGLLGRPGMREWAQVLAVGCARAATPCGLFAAASQGKAATTPPMDGRFLVQRGNELAYFAGVFREFETGLGLDVGALLEATRRGTVGMAWAPGFGGCWDRHVVGTADLGTFFRDRTEVPAGVYDPAVLERWTYYSGNLVGSLDLPELAAEWRAAVGYGAARFRVREGTVQVGDGAPVEVWLPALARWGP